METISAHHTDSQFGKNQFDTNRFEKSLQKLAFAGIPATRSEASTLLRLEYEPEPLAKIGVLLAGALFANDLFFDKAAIQRVASPILGKAAKMFYEFGVGAAYTVLRVSDADAEILVVGTSIRSTVERARFATEVDESIQRVADELKLLEELAAMPAEKFTQAWFNDLIHPDQIFLPALRAAFDLSRTLARCKAFLTIDGRVAALPECNMLKTSKRAGVLTGIVGELVSLNSQPGSVLVKVNNSKLVALRATGKSYIDQLSRKYHIGDMVRVSYEPIVDLLRSFEATPSKGTLLEMDSA
jgi:hypothetical protein